MIARKPTRLGFVEAASVPVVASTAWQMLFDRSGLTSTTRVLVVGGGQCRRLCGAAHQASGARGHRHRIQRGRGVCPRAWGRVESSTCELRAR